MPFGKYSLASYGINNETSTIKERKDGLLETTYYNASGKICGAAISKKDVQIWYTTDRYTAIDSYFGPRVSYKTIETRKEHKEITLKTQYYDMSSNLRGSSTSILRDYTDEWETTYSKPEPTQEERAEQLAQEQRRQAEKLAQEQQRQAEQARRMQAEKEKAAERARERYQSERPAREAAAVQRIDQEMQQFIANLSSWSHKTRSDAAGSIRSRIKYEDESSRGIYGPAYGPNFSCASAAYASAISHGAIQKLIPLLDDTNNRVKMRADEALLAISKKQSTDKKMSGYSEQIRNQIQLYQLKKYYLSQAGFFNSSHKIFANQSHIQAIQILKNRAQENPGGASEKTLRQFNL